jgi:hypothetical protein
MQALAERLNKLEAANATLQSENTELKAVAERREAETEYLKAQTKELREEGAVAANELAKVKGADWATKIKGRGDLRYRHESIVTERVVDGSVEDAEDRHRHRIRARLGFDATVTENVKATLLLATGADDPRSSNKRWGERYAQGNRPRRPCRLEVHRGGNLVSAAGTACWRPGVFLTVITTRKAASSSRPGYAVQVRVWLVAHRAVQPDLTRTDANVFGLQAG